MFQNPNYEQGIRQLFTDKALIYDPSAMKPMNVAQLNSWMKDFLDDNQDLVRMRIVFDRPPSVSDFGLRVKQNPSSHLYTEIGIKEGKRIYVDRTYSGLTDFHEEFAALKELEVDFNIMNTRVITLEVIIDKTSVEAFFFDGMYSMTNLVYPNKE